MQVTVMVGTDARVRQRVERCQRALGPEHRLEEVFKDNSARALHPEG